MRITMIVIKPNLRNKDSAGFTHESRDCVVRAIAEAYSIEYKEAHEICKAAGRKDKKGVNTIVVMNHIDNFDFYNANPKMTLATFLKKNPTGRFVVRLGGHALSVIDGIIYDDKVSYYNKPGRHVKQYWRI